MKYHYTQLIFLFLSVFPFHVIQSMQEKYLPLKKIQNAFDKYARDTPDIFLEGVCFFPVNNILAINWKHPYNKIGKKKFWSSSVRTYNSDYFPCTRLTASPGGTRFDIKNNY